MQGKRRVFSRDACSHAGERVVLLFCPVTKAFFFARRRWRARPLGGSGGVLFVFIPRGHAVTNHDDAHEHARMRGPAVAGSRIAAIAASIIMLPSPPCRFFFSSFASLQVLTYYGSMKERKAKRVGWTKPNAFHVCVTSYQTVLQDAPMFRRKRWCVPGGGEGVGYQGRLGSGVWCGRACSCHGRR